MLVLSCVQLFSTPWTIDHGYSPYIVHDYRQAPLSVEFSRQEYWSGLSFPSQGDFPDPEIEAWSLTWQADSLPLSHHSCSQVSNLLHSGFSLL